MSRQAIRLLIHGRVQGVGFRWWCVREAQGLGLAGWVRNRRDGAVEALAIGDPDQLQRLARACADGPAHALVERVEQAPGQDDGSLGFEERPTV